MLRLQFHVPTSPSFHSSTLLRNATSPFVALLSSPSRSRYFLLSIRFGFNVTLRCRPPRSVLISCKSSSGGSFSGDNAYEDLSDDDYLEAFLLVPETVAHHRMRRQGFRDEVTRWPSSGRLFSFSAAPARELRPPDFGSIGHGLLGRFQSPTIFLKVSCDGDFLLPIIVGEFAIEKLVAVLRGDNGDFPDQYQLVRNIVETLGYQVKMVRITERVVNTYFARLYFSKPGEGDILSVDARPSDAINIATRCKAPIFVSKQIVFMDAIKIGSYGVGRMRHTKTTYDVSLDSAADGPDLLAEELDIVKNMNLAVKDERYNDAAMWRDKLMELRKSKHEH